MLKTLLSPLIYIKNMAGDDLSLIPKPFHSCVLGLGMRLMKLAENEHYPPIDCPSLIHSSPPELS